MCPFSAPLVAQDFGCRHAGTVIRRGGAEIACRSEAACTRCGELHRAMKAAALTDQGYEDDLTEVPHSLLVRIQHGGLLGLQRITLESGTAIEDIDRLLESAVAKFGAVSAIPCQDLCPDIAGYRLPGRRHRKRKR
jgi:hypothetical protein